MSVILLTVFVLCCGGVCETMSHSITTPMASVTPSTTSAMILFMDVSISTLPTPSEVLPRSTALTTTAVPSTTSSIAVSPTTKAGNEDIPVIGWIQANAIITGLSGATLILSLLLVCMCYLWCCKKQKITVYEIVDVNKSDSEDGPPDGEVVSNPWAGHNGIATTATEPSTDNDLELKATQANSVVVRVVDHDQEMDMDKEQQEKQETVTVDMHEDIPQIDSMTIDWPDELGSLTNLS